MKTDKFLKCIADNNRRNILKFLDTKEKCVCEIINHLGLEQSLVSHHLQKLKDCGLVKCRQDGKNIYYTFHYSFKRHTKIIHQIQFIFLFKRII